jgi:hypothetical protein
MLAKRFLWIGGILLGLNVLIFFSRKQGFDYKHFADPKELYAPNAAQEQPFPFTTEQLLIARTLLTDSLRIDTCNSDQEKLLSINQFLYASICSNHVYGVLDKSYDDPLSLFENLRSDKKLAFQCGEAAYLQAFFYTAAGLKSRYIQHVQKPHLNIPPDSHVYNEVWLSEKNQWALSDLFQNRHLIKQHGNYLTATDLYDARVRSDSALFTVYQTDSNRIEQITKAIRDPYFSKSYYLIFFEQTDPEIVYSWKNKWRHYLLDYSHFQIYDPLGPSSNFRHRVKQFVFFGWLLWLVIFAVRLTKRIP